jgi:hypothetical protein
VDPLLGDPLVAPCGKDKKLPEVRSCFFWLLLNFTEITLSTSSLPCSIDYTITRSSRSFLLFLRTARKQRTSIRCWKTTRMDRRKAWSLLPQLNLMIKSLVAIC